MDIRNKKLSDDEFYGIRKEIMGQWPTGKDVDFDEAIESVSYTHLDVYKRQPYITKNGNKENNIMNKIIECVPNFSEGRDKEKIEKIVDCFRNVDGVKLLDYSSDEDHNRSVVTVIGLSLIHISRVKIVSNDEIGMIGLEYNKMAENIETLIEKVYKMELTQKQAELEFLQMQINPHFL